MAALPAFRFHPDPVRSGSVTHSAATCAVCGQARGYVYTSTTYGERDLDGALCPWCIADGRAHASFGVTFHDLALPDDLDPVIADEIEQRTPGFATFNPFAWLVCCELPMAYLEPAGIAGIRTRYRELEGQLLAAIVHDLGRSGGSAHQLLAALRRDTAPCAHVFGCQSCGTRRAHLDHL